MHLLNKNHLSTYYVPGSFLEAEHTTAKDRRGTYIPEEYTDAKKSKCDNWFAIAVQQTIL